MTNKLYIKPHPSLWCSSGITKPNAAVEQRIKDRGQNNIFKWCKGLSTDYLSYLLL